MDDLLPLGFVGLALSVVGLLASVSLLVWEVASKRRSIKLVVQDLGVAVEEAKPPRVYTRCACGRFSRRIAGGHGWLLYECTRHGIGWHTEKLVGEAEPRVPFQIVVVPEAEALTHPEGFEIDFPQGPTTLELINLYEEMENEPWLRIASPC